jgi:hypothetical protein
MVDMPTMRRLGAVALVLGLVVIASDGGARTGDLSNDPADLVKAYLTLDTRGARLDSMSWESLRPYVSWKEEPAWGHMVVIEGYEVVDDLKRWEVISNVEVLIPVEFEVLGSVYWETAAFLPEKHKKEVKFRVKAVTSRWKIVEPMMPPHVSLRRAINYVREAVLEERDSVRRGTLESLVNDLKKTR